MGIKKKLFTFFFCSTFILYNQMTQAAPGPGGDDRLGTLLTMSLDELVNLDVSLATGTPKPLKLAPAVATVITADDIKRIGAATLDEALQIVSGLTVMPSNFNRMNSVYSIRGIHTQQNPQVLTLLDGVPIRELVNGSRHNTFSMSTANIERIEVVKGPGSALYGADAFSGTINIITKKADDLGGVQAGVRTGSFGYTDTWFQYGDTIKGWDVTFSFDYMRHDGDTSRIVDKDLQTTLDAAFGTSASLAPGPLETDDRIHDVQFRIANENWGFRFWKWGQDDGGEGAGGGQILDPVGIENIDNYLADLTYRKPGIMKNLDMDLRLSYNYSDQDNYLVIFPPGAVIPIGTDGNADFASPVGPTLFTDGFIGFPGGKQQAENIDLSFTFSGLSSHLLRFGGGYEYSAMDAKERKNFGPGVLNVLPLPPVQNGTLTDVTGTQFIFMDDKDRTNWHLLLQDEWSFAENWELTAGVRYDDYSDFGSTINPRLALVWDTRYNLVTKLLYGRAFRAPSFGELYFINNPLSLGNEDLEPEIIDTVELAFNYKPTENFYTTLSLFAYEIDGLINYVQDPGQTTKTAQNAYDQEGQGFELEADWLITESLHAHGNFSYQHSENKNNSETIPFAPEMVLYANLHWQLLPEWFLDGQYYWIAARERAPEDIRDDIKDNDIVNLTIRRTNIGKHWEVALAVRNIFNENVREPSTEVIPNDYPMEQRSFWAELRFSY